MKTEPQAGWPPSNRAQVAQVFATVLLGAATIGLGVLGFLGYKKIEPIVVHQVYTLERQRDAERQIDVEKALAEQFRGGHAFTQKILDWWGSQYVNYIQLVRDYKLKERTGAKYEVKESVHPRVGKIVTIISHHDNGNAVVFNFEVPPTVADFIMHNLEISAFPGMPDGQFNELKNSIADYLRRDIYLRKVSLAVFDPRSFEQSVAEFLTSVQYRDFRHIAPHIRGLDTVIEDVLVSNQPPPG